MFDFLFDDIGAKIKNWAKGIFILEALACVIAGIILIKTSKLLAFLLILLAVPVGWVSSCILYALGDICENLQLIAQNSYAISETSKEISKSAKEENSQPVAVQKKSDELPDL